MKQWIYPHEANHLARTVETLRNDGIILHPTDSIWGIAGRVSKQAHEKIVKLKGRPPEKPFIIGVASEDMLRQYMNDVTEEVVQFIKSVSRPTTIIGKAKNLPDWAIATDGTVAIRIMKHIFSTAMIELLGEPIFTTSPNKSGSPTPQTFREIDPEIKAQVDYIVSLPEEMGRTGRPSRIIKITPKGFTIIRP
ncbi:MAG: L-threonylcarbamoyladenylate synthase [Chlorobi bacterium]|nr:L-threonylcarbamoyladenylate synthase [Chlorobiota bacterium]